MNEAEAALDRAEILCQLRRYDQALALLSRAVAADPDNPRAWCLMAQAQLGRDDQREALRAAETAIPLAPESEWPHRLASLALGRLGRHEQAAREAREAVRLAPEAWQTHVRLARAALHTGRLDEARNGSDLALALEPNEADVHLVAGEVAAAAGHPEEAQAHLRQALAIDPDNAAAHNELARLHLREGGTANPVRLARAAEGFATAVRSAPHVTVTRRNLDLVLHGFLSRIAYVVFIGAFVIARFSRQPIPALGRAGLLALLAIFLCAFAWQFVGRLTSDLRRYLVRALLGRRLRPVVGFDALAIGCLVASTVVAADSRRVSLAVVALGAAVVARLLLLREWKQRT